MIRNRFIYFILFGLTLLNVFLATFYLRHGDLGFSTDVARDFLLYQEVDQKKIILIGPRSSTSGIFHGPLWIYLNYPAYLIGNGNPLVVEQFWIILSILFIGSGFFVAKKLFGNLPAFVYMLLLSGNMIFQSRSLFNPHGALFLVPVFFLTIVYYQKYLKLWLLVLHLIITALIIQFQMAVGIPLVILSGFYTLLLIIKNKKYVHLIAFLVIPVFLLNFFIFEARHNFNMTRSILNYAGPKTDDGIVFNYLSQIDNRLERLTDLQLLNGAPGYLMGLLFAFTLVFTYLKVKQDNKQKTVYFLFLYYFLGYTFLTFVNKGIVLNHQFFPMFAITNLWFASFASLKNRKLYLLLLTIIVLFIYRSYDGFTTQAKDNVIGIDLGSWKLLHEMGRDIASTAPQEFGYFVYAPDAFAYQQRYAMIYSFKEAGKKAFEFEKKPATFIIASPAPPDKPYLNYHWWLSDRVNIKKDSEYEDGYPGGYLVQRYNLNNDEIKVPYEPTINVGIHFR